MAAQTNRQPFLVGCQHF